MTGGKRQGHWQGKETGANAREGDRGNDRGKRQGQWQAQETEAMTGEGNSQCQVQETGAMAGAGDRGREQGQEAGAENPRDRVSGRDWVINEAEIHSLDELTQIRVILRRRNSCCSARRVPGKRENVLHQLIFSFFLYRC